MPARAAKFKLAFLFLHGWMGRQNIGAAKVLADLGFKCLTYDMRGNGQSEGDPAKITKAEYFDDALFAYDYLRQKVGDEFAIGVVGSSFGSYLGVRLTGQRAIHCLSLRVPANYPDEKFDQLEPVSLHSRRGLYWEWRSTPLQASQNLALGALHTFNGPVQIVEAGKDNQIPRQTVLNYLNAVADKSKLTYDVMKDAPHSLVNDKLQAEYEKLLTSWAKRFLESE